MEGLKELKTNIEKLIDGAYDDEFIDALINCSCGLEELNRIIDEQLSYSDCKEVEL